MGKKEKRNASCAGEKGKSEEAMRNRLMWMARLPRLATVMLRAGLLPRAMSWSMTLMQQWGICVDICDSCCH